MCLQYMFPHCVLCVNLFEQSIHHVLRLEVWTTGPVVTIVRKNVLRLKSVMLSLQSRIRLVVIFFIFLRNAMKIHHDQEEIVQQVLLVCPKTCSLISMNTHAHCSLF